MPPARKREIYAIARAAGLIILEDDAYYWLQVMMLTACCGHVML